MTFPEQLQHHRRRLKLTQAEVARILETSPRTYADWEKGVGKTPSQPHQRGIIITLRAAQHAAQHARKKTDDA